MRKLRDILRLRFDAGLAIRQIKASTKVSVGAIQKLLAKAKAQELIWSLPEDLDDTALAGLFYPAADTRSSSRFQVPDWSSVHQELKRKGMTLQLHGRSTRRNTPTVATATLSSATVTPSPPQAHTRLQSPNRSCTRSAW